MEDVLMIDSEAFAAAFGRGPLALGHRLTEHDLLTPEAIAELADVLPPSKVEHNRGDVPALLAEGDAPRLEATPGEIARGIETNGCWMVLKNIELEPDYGRLLGDSLDELVPYLHSREGRMLQREGFVFLSAPGSITPSHVDPEHNLLLQVRGSKEMNVGSFPDSETAQRELERFYSGGERNIPVLPAATQTFDLEPGDGVYVPPSAPHWVKNGPTVSVSLSITFRTPASQRIAQVHALNARLRRLHLSPRPPADGLADRAKATLYRSLKPLAGRGRG
jgi:cupin superfamily protein